MTHLDSSTVLTIGHSTSSYEDFLARLRKAHVTAIADVRTSPFSSRFPWFSRDPLKTRLKQDGVAYSFLGRELGGRPTEIAYFRQGVADYEAMATTTAFRSGLGRVEAGARHFRIALMCSEGHPLDCHRCLLVGRALASSGVGVEHVLPDGAIATQTDMENHLLRMAANDHDDLFATREERLNAAYRDRARKVAYALSQAAPRAERAPANADARP